MTGPAQRDSLLRRGAVGFWLCAVGAIGLLRAGVPIVRDAALPGDAVGWIWLVGATVVMVAGIVMVVRAARQPQ